MGILDSLTGIFEDVIRPRGRRKSIDQNGKRRTKFIAYLEVQRKAIKNPPSKTKGKRGQRIDWFEHGDKFVFGPRFGSRKLHLREDRPHTIIFNSREELEKNIDAIIQATQAGELDGALAKAAERQPKPAAPAEQPSTKSKRDARES